MEFKRLAKNLAPGETFGKALYKKLTEKKLSENQYKTDDLGEDMAVVCQVINGWWKPRFILNHNAKTAIEFMSHDQYLLTVGEEDIEWTTLETLPTDIQDNARLRSAVYPTLVGNFINGVARVSWQIHPDGRYWMDDDGFGMTSDVEVEIYGYINREGSVVGKFRLPNAEDTDIDYRKLAEAEELLRENCVCSDGVYDDKQIITYTANEQLNIKAEAFTPYDESHTFEEETGTGIITFPEDLAK